MRALPCGGDQGSGRAAKRGPLLAGCALPWGTVWRCRLYSDEDQDKEEEEEDEGGLLDGPLFDLARTRSRSNGGHTVKVGGREWGTLRLLLNTLWAGRKRISAARRGPSITCKASPAQAPQKPRRRAWP